MALQGRSPGEIPAGNFAEDTRRSAETPTRGSRNARALPSVPRPTHGPGDINNSVSLDYFSIDIFNPLDYFPSYQTISSAISFRVPKEST